MSDELRCPNCGSDSIQERGDPTWGKCLECDITMRLEHFSALKQNKKEREALVRDLLIHAPGWPETEIHTDAIAWAEARADAVLAYAKKEREKS